MDQQTSNQLVAEKIGQILQQKRVELGLSPVDCAGLIYVEPRIYTAFETGAEYPSLPEFEALGYYLDFLPEELHRSGILAVQSGEDPDRGCFAGPVQSEETENRSFADSEGESVQRPVSAVVGLLKVFNFEYVHGAVHNAVLSCSILKAVFGRERVYQYHPVAMP